MSPKLQVIYFPAKGRAEPVRLALHISGFEFEDTRITDWPSIKADQPFGALPTLVVDGKAFSDSNSQLRYIGTLGSLYPKDALVAFHVDELMAACEDVMSAGTAAFIEKDEEKKKTLRQEYAEKNIVPFLKNAARFIEAHGSNGFAVGDALTVADLKFYIQLVSLEWLDHIPKDILEPYPTLIAHRDKIAALPKVAEWNAMKH